MWEVYIQVVACIRHLVVDALEEGSSSVGVVDKIVAEEDEQIAADIEVEEEHIVAVDIVEEEQIVVVEEQIAVVEEEEQIVAAGTAEEEEEQMDNHLQPAGKYPSLVGPRKGCILTYWI